MKVFGTAKTKGAERFFRARAGKKFGFSLAELLVVLSIIGLISTVVLANIAHLSARTKVEAAANTLLESLKDIRHKSVSVKKFKSNLFPSYGIYIDTNKPNRIIVYADCIVDDNGDNWIDNKDIFYYNASSTDCNGENGFVREIKLDKEVKIKEIRSYDLNGGEKKETKLYMEYIRPEPTFWATNASLEVMEFKKIEIDITDIRGRYKRTIIIWTTGQFAKKQ